jgi:XTP/dITP diphosphohydrolase
MEILLASGNAGKVREIRALTAGLALEWVSLGDLPALQVAEETGGSFVANALLKASEAARQSGLVTVADDSGLCVDALDGAPGVDSAIYAGAHGDDAANKRLLLAHLADVPDAQRGAHFHCTAALVCPRDHALAQRATPPEVDRLDAHPCLGAGLVAFVAEGEVRGRILREESGAGGFGYDPLFFHPPSGATFGELDTDAKNRLSHRHHAFRRLVRVLGAL